MIKLTDDLGREVKLTNIPNRLISTVPSLTELLFDLGLGDRVVGVTKFCVHPKGIKKERPLIGGTKSLNIDEIQRLNPDLIIANKEENQREQIDLLSAHFNVYITDISTIQSSINTIKAICDLFGATEIGGDVIRSIERCFDKPIFFNNKVLYLIWKDPFMSIGGDTYISDVITRLGLENVLSNKNRYPELTKEEIITLAPHYIFLSSEPFPFKEKHISDLQKTLPQSKVVLVDGEAFSWYGSRLMHIDRYFIELRNQMKKMY